MLVTMSDAAGTVRGYRWLCHGCGLMSPPRKAERLPPRWAERMEPAYGLTGQRRRGMGWVVNYYCPGCVAVRCTAATVAATTRKLFGDNPTGRKEGR